MAAPGTPWFKLFSQLRDHPKLEDLIAELGVNDAEAVGHLVLLWCWVTDYHPDGDVSGVTNKRLARAARWCGDADLFVTSLSRCGWLDGEPGAYRLHNWMTYAESYKRAKSQKSKRSSEDTSGTTPSTGTVPVQYGQSTGTVLTEYCGEERRGEEQSRAEHAREPQSAQPSVDVRELEQRIGEWNFDVGWGSQGYAARELAPFTEEEIAYARAKTEQDSTTKAKVKFFLGVIRRYRRELGESQPRAGPSEASERLREILIAERFSLPTGPEERRIFAVCEDLERIHAAAARLSAAGVHALPELVEELKGGGDSAAA